jgi:hypothetical protein
MRLVWVIRIATAVLLGLAAILLASDAHEYPGYTRAAMRSLVAGTLPLYFAGLLNLLAVDGTARFRWAALVADIFLLAFVLTHLRGGAAPLFWMLGAVSALLTCALSTLIVRERSTKNQTPASSL